MSQPTPADALFRDAATDLSACRLTTELLSWFSANQDRMTLDETRTTLWMLVSQKRYTWALQIISLFANVDPDLSLYDQIVAAQTQV